MGFTLEVEDQPDLTIPEDTIVRARLKEIKLREFDWTDRQTNEQKHGKALEWWFDVLDDRFPNRSVKGQTDFRVSNHPRNKFRMWAEAILGRELPVGMKIDTDDLTGMVCEISIRHRSDKKDPSKKYEEVDEVMPADGGAGFSDEPPF